MGRRHRLLFHSVPEAVVVGLLVSGDVKGAAAAVIHVLTDDAHSVARTEIKEIIKREARKRRSKRKREKL